MIIALTTLLAHFRGYVFNDVETSLVMVSLPDLPQFG
jgi:hypothetical protein